jgi:hypothetical protein
MEIIVDRKHKRANSDNQWSDPLGVEQAKREKARTIEIPKDSINPAYQMISLMGVKSLLGLKAFCLNDRKEMISGIIVDIIPPFYISLRNKGVFKLDDVVSMGDI